MNERARCPGEIRRLGGHKRALGILVDLVVCEACGLRQWASAMVSSCSALLPRLSQRAKVDAR